MFQVPDPKLCVLCHLMSPLEAIDPVLESPLVQPLFKQRVTAGELVNEVAQAKTAVTGMLLANMERNGTTYRICLMDKQKLKLIPCDFSRVSIHNLLCDKHFTNESCDVLQ